MSAPVWFWGITAFLFGITIGSFLNVVIYRLPIGKSLAEPKRSFCPNCGHDLTGLDLVPLLSFLALGRRCRYCRQAISWRYFGVELLTGLLFVAVGLRYLGDAPTCVALLLFTAVLISIFFIDLATFTIPLSLNLLLFLIAVGRDVWGIAAREPGHELLWGWLPRSVLAGVVGALIFALVRLAGWIWKGVEAMGLGDVLLARGMGAMLIAFVPVGDNPLRLFPIWVFLSCLSGIIVGPALIWLRNRQANADTASAHLLNTTAESSTNDAPDANDEQMVRDGTLRMQLEEIGWCLILGDAKDWWQERGEPITADEVYDDGPPAPTAIPFGPFLAIGFLATVFFGEWITAGYLAYAFRH